MNTQRLWFWILFPAVTMSLGWMLRGYIGGGPLGAMIPGAMVGLALCLLLSRHRDAGFIAAFAAVGIGFGGQETYGQTVGLSMVPETYSWAILGFALKGGVWGFLGGALLGVIFQRDRFTNRDLILSFALMVAGTHIGWKLFNEPKIVYFSHPTDRPRAELWFGLYLGAFLLLAFLARTSTARLPWSFALYGLIGGGIGFASGAAAQVAGKAAVPVFPFGWWKFMEMTFGFLLGGALGACAWRNRNQIPAQTIPSSPAPIPGSVVWAALSIAITLVLHPAISSRLHYTIAGAILLAISLYSERFSWQTAITTTYCAFAIDLLRYRPTYPAEVMWTLVVITSIVVAAVVARRPRVGTMLLLFTWTSTGFGLMKSFLPPAKIDRPIHMETMFILFAVLVTVSVGLLRPAQRQMQEQPGGALVSRA